MTQTKTSKRLTLSQSNKKFWALPAAEKRIAIAKDVIKQVESNFYIAATGTYLTFDLMKDIDTKPIDKFDKLLGVVKKQKGKCEVCGIGGCFVSLVRLGDKIESSDFVSSLMESGDSCGDGLMKSKLREIFSQDQLSMIECAFEQSSSHGYADFDLRQRAADWGLCQSYDPDKRLVAIMKNIIKNKGEFKPLVRC